MPNPRPRVPSAGLWNLASLFSNLCLFVLMPFAFFFLESEGFAGLKKVSHRVSGLSWFSEGGTASRGAERNAASPAVWRARGT